MTKIKNVFLLILQFISLECCGFSAFIAFVGLQYRINAKNMYRTG